MGPRSVAGLSHVISIIMDHLTAQYGVFIVEAHFKNGYSVVTHEKQSYSYWEPENSEYLRQRSFHSEKQFDGDSHPLLSLALTSLKPALLQRLL